MPEATVPRRSTDAVVLKAYMRIGETWALGPTEAAGLADMSESQWHRARAADFSEELTEEQLLRLSALIGIYHSLESYFSDPLAKEWITRPNCAPMFGGRSPVETAIEGGLPQILAIRRYLEALLCGY